MRNGVLIFNHRNPRLRVILIRTLLHYMSIGQEDMKVKGYATSVLSRSVGRLVGKWQIFFLINDVSAYILNMIGLKV